MRAVAGSALVVRAGLTLRSDPPPMNVTIPAILLLGAGILLIAGLWTPIAGVAIAMTEVWKMVMPMPTISASRTSSTRLAGFLTRSLPS